MSFLKALEKMGLVELDETERKKLEAQSKRDADMSMAEIDKLLAAEGIDPGAGKAAAPKPAPARPAAAPAASPPRSQPSAPASSKGASAIKTGVPFTELYQAAGVKEPPYPAEKLLKLIDGLRSMDTHTRKMAILAMDAADDAWTIADPVLDAKRKMSVLSQHQSSLRDQLQSAEARMRDELAKLDAYQAQAVATIHAKIAELEKSLEKELNDVAQRKAALEKEHALNQRACEEEEIRLSDEVRRLEEVPRGFESALQKPPA